MILEFALKRWSKVFLSAPHASTHTHTTIHAIDPIFSKDWLNRPHSGNTEIMHTVNTNAYKHILSHTP